jgi:FHS family L-fucose permease-like MFS transporter
MVIRDPYVILGIVIIGVLVLFTLSKMPDSKDDSQNSNIGQTFKKLFANPSYSQGVFAQILYVGAQIMCWTYIYQYAEGIGMDSVTAGYFQMAAFVLFTVGRAIGTYLLRFINAGRLLMLFSFFAISFTLGVVVINNVLGLYCLIGVSFFMSLMFPTIYGIALGKLSEEESKIGSAGLVMAIVGGALMPKLQGMIIDIGGYGVNDVNVLGISEINFSFLLPIICFVFIAVYGFKNRQPEIY